jgi:23S rRNA (cytosine1962-C5)-methyltransferase
MELILFEDEHLLVVDKPAGWNTHAPDPFAGEGIYDWLKHREPRWAKLAIIHRLDKETSGVLLFGKTAEANRSLTKQFASRAIRKKYLLLTDHEMPRQEFVARSAIVRAGEKYVSRPLGADGEPAETRFAMVKAYDGFTMIEAEPVTGRTHQIRVHAGEHGFPILGDSLYGGVKAPRLFLHAVEIFLRHPATNEPLKFASPPNWPYQTLAHMRQSLVSRFMHVRAGVIQSALTSAWRIVHGASDDCPNVYVDKLGDFLLVESERGLSSAEQARAEGLAHALGVRGTYHKLLDRKVRRTNPAGASPQLLFGERAPDRFTIRENGLVFELSFEEGYSVGLFLDQRDNRRRFLGNYIAADFGPWSAGLRFGALEAGPAENEPNRRPALQVEVLNTFAYTCGFSVAAAKAGARTTSLDLSKKYLEWGKRNFALNQIDPAEHDFIYGDAFEWMRRLGKKGRVFDVVVLDPPTFSQSKESGAWQAEKNYGQLVESALPLLKRDGVLFASTNAAKMEPEKFLSVIHEAIGKSRRKILQQHYVPQPPDFPITRAEPAYLKTVWLRIG